jgi:hypothetical protein
LNIAPPVIIPESITIFSVTRTPNQTGEEEGSLRKIDAKIAGQPVLSLEDALKWIDQNVADGHPEYLVRVEKDEKIPQMVLACLNIKSVLIRLRGYNQEWKITHDGSTRYYANGTPTTRDALITIGFGNYFSDITLQLEQYITIDGEDIPANNTRRGMVTLTPGRTLIMKSGSKITGYNHGTGTLVTFNVIYALVDNQSPPVNVGKFILDGGAITGNKVIKGVICTGGLASDNLSTFIYKSGEVYDNVTDTDESGNYRIYTYTDGESINLPEILPPITND